MQTLTNEWFFFHSDSQLGEGNRGEGTNQRVRSADPTKLGAAGGIREGPRARGDPLHGWEAASDRVRARCDLCGGLGRLPAVGGSWGGGDALALRGKPGTGGSGWGRGQHRRRGIQGAAVRRGALGELRREDRGRPAEGPGDSGGRQRGATCRGASQRCLAAPPPPLPPGF